MIYNRLFNDLMKNRQETVDQKTTKILTEKEVEGLKYLGGYVIRKLFMKLKTVQNKQESDEQAMQILLAGKAEENLMSSSFVENMSRGGLWIITEDIQKIFIITEKYFCVQTAVVGLREININKFVDKLNNFSPLLMIFRHIVSDCNATVNDQVEMNTLSSILTPYLRVRTFSLAKDIVAKQKGKIFDRKALRKSTKLSSKREDTK